MTTARIMTVAGLAVGLTLGLAACSEVESESAEATSSAPEADATADSTATNEAPAAEPAAEEVTTMAGDTTESQGTLATTLSERKSQFRSQASEELSTLFEAGVDEVAQSGLLAEAVNVGDTAPEFGSSDTTWFNHLGQNPDLASLRGKAVLIEFWATW